MIMETKNAARISSSRYWYQARPNIAGRKCGAPLCLIMYSVQKMAVSIADIGLSR